MNQPPSQQGPWATPPPPPGLPPHQYPPNVVGAQWYPQPPWSPPPVPAKRGGVWIGLLGGLSAVAAVIVAASVIVALAKTGDPDLIVGQCVSSDDYVSFNLRPTDCGDINAIYEFAGEAALGICPDGLRAADGSYFFIEKNSKEILCFALNLREGECYLMAVSGKTVDHVACADAPSRANSTTGAMKVSERIDGDADPTRCREDTVPLAYPEPARLYCLEKAAGGQAST